VCHLVMKDVRGAASLSGRLVGEPGRMGPQKKVEEHCASNSWRNLQHSTLSTAQDNPSRTMGAVKRKAEQGATPSKKAKGAPSDRSAKRRKSDVDQQSPAKAKLESAAPPASVFKDEEKKSFPRGGASVLTPLEHKQIQIKANQDVLFEQSGQKRPGGDDGEGYSDMGSDDDEKKSALKSKKKLIKKSKKTHESGDKEDMVKVESLSYKVRKTLRSLGARLTMLETVAWNHCTRSDYGYFPPRPCARAPQQPCRLRAAHRCVRQAQREAGKASPGGRE
jgi:hypothetical protein